MSASEISKFTTRHFSLISLILNSHNCCIKDFDLSTGMFTIKGKTKESVINCENSIYNTLTNSYKELNI